MQDGSLADIKDRQTDGSDARRQWITGIEMYGRLLLRVNANTVHRVIQCALCAVRIRRREIRKYPVIRRACTQCSRVGL